MYCNFTFWVGLQRFDLKMLRVLCFYHLVCSLCLEISEIIRSLNLQLSLMYKPVISKTNIYCFCFLHIQENSLHGLLIC